MQKKYLKGIGLETLQVQNSSVYWTALRIQAQSPQGHRICDEHHDRMTVVYGSYRHFD